LDERSGCVRHPEREDELVELREEQRRHGGRDQIAAAAEQRCTPEDDCCDGR
jgi:hypothetical protein